MILTVIEGPESGHTVTIAAGASLSIGRGSSNDLTLGDEIISRKHARIDCEGEQFRFQDLGSSYGTKINGVPVTEPTALSAGDLIELGHTRLQFGETAEPNPPPAPLAPPAPPAAPPEKAPAADIPPPASEAAPPPVPQPVVSHAEEFAMVEELYSESMMRLKREVHEEILARVNTSKGLVDLNDPKKRREIEGQLDEVLKEVRHRVPSKLDFATFRQALLDELVGFGPLSPLIRDESISEIMVNGPACVYVERNGNLFQTPLRFFDNKHLLAIIGRIVEPLGRRVDESSPMVDARLPDGSRVNAIVSPLALDGHSVTIRKFMKDKLTADDLIDRFNSITRPMAECLAEAVRAKQNVLVSGGTGSGKTTLLNILSLSIPTDERLVTIEDSAELKLHHGNLVRLETRAANIEGTGEIGIRELVRNSLRMRPDRIIVGECRGAEAIDMLQAMNTGHDGSLTTVHANSTRDALMRLENMVMMAGFDLPSVAIREQIASAIKLVVQQQRLPDGSRKVVEITEITGRENDVILCQPIFEFKQEGFENGKITGRFVATGNRPEFVSKLKAKGDLRIDDTMFQESPGA